MFLRSTLRRTESLCCKFFSWFPLGLVAFLTTWALYVQAYTICLRHVGGKTGYAWAALTVVLYAMALWCYYTACLTPPGSPSSPIPKPLQDLSYSLLPTTSTTSHERDVELGAPTSTITVKENGKTRYCTKCQCPKPDRAHHCSVCGVCVLKMDHHCPWLSTCVGWNNYKPFVLFLVYVTLFATSCFAGTCLAIYWWTLEPYSGVEDEFLQLSWVLLAALSGCITIIVGAFGGWHLSLCLRNITTIESLESTRYSTPHPLSRLRRSAPTNIEIGNAFDLGYYANWCQVFGERKTLWWVPVDGGRRGDGRVFEVSGEARQRLEEVAMRVRSEEERHLGRWESEWADVEEYSMA